MHQTNEEKSTMKLGGETETQSHHKPHPSTLTPPCPRLPGSPRTACTLTPPCPSLPGSPRTACTLTPPCPRLPGSPRIACTLGLVQQSQKLLLTRHLLVAWLWWPLGLARKCPTGMLQSINPWPVARAQGQQLERSKTVIIYRWHDTKKKTLKTLPNY